MFAGQPLIEAHDRSELLECAGIVLCESAAIELDGLAKELIAAYPRQFGGIAGQMSIPAKRPINGYVLCPDQWLCKDAGFDIDAWHKRIFSLSNARELVGPALTKYNNTKALRETAIRQFV